MVDNQNAVIFVMCWFNCHENPTKAISIPLQYYDRNITWWESIWSKVDLKFIWSKVTYNYLFTSSCENKYRQKPRNLGTGCTTWYCLPVNRKVPRQYYAIYRGFPCGVKSSPTWTKWPPFRRRYFQTRFREWFVLYFDQYFTEVCSQGFIWQ